MQQNLSYIYGPLYSWRLGMSLGVDPLSTKKKVCTFNCTYCQLGDEDPVGVERRVFVETDEIIRELALVDLSGVSHITFSGCGEPTLAKNLGEMITAVSKKYPMVSIAVITNGSLLSDAAVRREISGAGSVLVKCDASMSASFLAVNRPGEQSADFSRFLDGIRRFRAEYTGRFILQIMFVDNNKKDAQGIAAWAKGLSPDEVQINTPLRPSNEKPLDEKALSSIKEYFFGLSVVSVYDKEHKKYHPIDVEKTKKRHGNFENTEKK